MPRPTSLLSNLRVEHRSGSTAAKHEHPIGRRAGARWERARMQNCRRSAWLPAEDVRRDAPHIAVPGIRPGPAWQLKDNTRFYKQREISNAKCLVGSPN